MKRNFALNAALAVVAMMTVSSCDNDSKEDAGGPGALMGRKLLSITETSFYGSESTTEFIWDNGNITAFKETEGEDGREHGYAVSYNGRQADIKSIVGETVAVANLDGNGCVASWKLLGDYDPERSYYRYDNQLRLVSYDDGVDSKGKIVYTGNGDIASATINEETVTFSYTNEDVRTPIENKGAIMLMSEWQIMWDWEYFYWFGVYGKAAAHLPVRVGTKHFEWTIDEDGFPTRCVITGEYEDERSEIRFEWE